MILQPVCHYGKKGKVPLVHYQNVKQVFPFIKSNSFIGMGDEGDRVKVGCFFFKTSVRCLNPLSRDAQCSI